MHSIYKWIKINYLSNSCFISLICDKCLIQNPFTLFCKDIALRFLTRPWEQSQIFILIELLGHLFRLRYRRQWTVTPSGLGRVRLTMIQQQIYQVSPKWFTTLLKWQCLQLVLSIVRLLINKLLSLSLMLRTLTSG